MTRKKIIFTAFIWHRRIGLAAIVLLIILAITGMMLNHTEGLQLDETYVESSALLNWYGLEPEGEIISYAIKKHMVSSWGSQLFFNKKTIATSAQTLRGAVHSEQLIIVAFDSEIFLLSHDGKLIDRISTHPYFSSIKRIGLKDDRPVIESNNLLYYMADEQVIDWNTTTANNIEWSLISTLDKTQTIELRKAYRGNSLNMERVILDLHSGRIFGQYGIYLMDAAAIILIWLSLSGLWIWQSRKGKQKQKRHYQKHRRG